MLFDIDSVGESSMRERVSRMFSQQFSELISAVFCCDLDESSGDDWLIEESSKFCFIQYGTISSLIPGIHIGEFTYCISARRYTEFCEFSFRSVDDFENGCIVIRYILDMHE